jgi:hypothetical protein
MVALQKLTTALTQTLVEHGQLSAAAAAAGCVPGHRQCADP